MRISCTALALAVGALLAACSHDDGPLVPGAIETIFPANATAVAGNSIATAPSVRVTTTKGKPVPNVAVTFAVASGGGNILGADQTTNAEGVATVIFWKLGTTAGPNTLTATVDGVAPATFSATGIAGPASRLGMGTAPSSSAANHAPLPTQPVVQIQDVNGNLVASSTAQVVATLVSGTGTLGGTTTVAAVAGLATFTNLSIGGTIGAKSIGFASTGLTSTQADLTTTAGAASIVSASAGSNQSALPGTDVSVPPAVLVTDADANPVSGVGVSFAVTGGGGSITGASPSTNASGVATVGSWTLGASIGANTLQATVGTLSGSPVTFTAVASDIAITTIVPATLTSGATATFTGNGFGATVGANAVTIDGVTATVTAASPTSLTVTVPALPCTPAHTATVGLSVSGAPPVTKQQPVRAASLVDLAIGGSAIMATAAEARCNELSNTGGTYYVAVYNSSTTYSTTGASFELKGTAGASSVVAPAPVAARSLIATMPQDPTRAAMDVADRAHVNLLERNIQFAQQQLVAGRFSRGAAALRSIAPFAGGVSNAVGDQVSLNLPDLRANFCTTGIPLTGRVAYVGTHAIIVEDIANPLAGTIDTTYNQIGTEFDGMMWDILTTNYGDPLAMDTQTDNNQRFIMVFTNKMNPGLELGSLGLAGFVVSSDFVSKSQCAASNVGEYFYATSPTGQGTINTVGSPPRWAWAMRGTIIHEVKHIVSFAERFARNASSFEQSWLEETNARVSEELYERARYGFTQRSNIGYGSAANMVGPYCGVRLACNQPRGIVRVFEELAATGTFGGWYSAPHNFSPFGRFSSSDFSFYSTGWSLVRWMTDASSNTESAILKGMTQSSTLSGIANLENATGLTFAASQPKWIMSMLVDDYPGVAIADPALKNQSWNLRNVYLGYDLDFTVPWVQWPLVPLTASFGSFSGITSVRAGTAAVIQLSGTQTAKQLLELKASGSSAGAPTELRLAIVRIQ